MNFLKKLRFPPEAIVTIDREVVDYKLFGEWTEDGVCLVNRLKDNADYRPVDVWSFL